MSSVARKPATVSLPADLMVEVRRVCKAKRTTPRKFVVNALRRQLAVAEFRRIRSKLRANAESRGLGAVTDDEVFRSVS
jgi:hypothetical protein